MHWLKWLCFFFFSKMNWNVHMAGRECKNWDSRRMVLISLFLSFVFLCQRQRELFSLFYSSCTCEDGKAYLIFSIQRSPFFSHNSMAFYVKILNWKETSGTTESNAWLKRHLVNILNTSSTRTYEVTLVLSLRLTRAENVIYISLTIYMCEHHKQPNAIFFFRQTNTQLFKKPNSFKFIVDKIQHWGAFFKHSEHE